MTAWMNIVGSIRKILFETHEFFSGSIAWTNLRLVMMSADLDIRAEL